MRAVRPIRQHPKGVALVAVLWITSLLALMAAGIGSSSRTSAKLAFNAVENTKARWLAEAGVQRAIFDLLTDARRQSWPAGGVQRYALPLEGDRVVIEIQDEDGKIDLNATSPEILEGLFGAIGLDPEQAAVLASRVVDFRDDDSETEPGGAEDEAYLAAGLVRGAADRPFWRIEELADVLGVTDAVYQRIRPNVTIYSDAEGVDPLRASATTLRALPGMTPEIEAAILESAAAEEPYLDLSDVDLAEVETYMLPSRELIFSIRSLGISEGGGRFVREAIIALDGGLGDLPFTTYSWQRGTLRTGE